MSESILQASPYNGLTFDPNRKGPDVILSENNLTATLGNRGHSCFLNRSRSSGRYYFEMKLVNFEGNQQWGPVVGIATEQSALVAPWLVDTGQVLHYSIPPGDVISIFQFDQRSTYPIKWLQGDVVGYAIDLDNKTLKLCANGAFGPTVSFADVTNKTTFYPIACSSGGLTSNLSVVQIQSKPRYCPLDYSLW